MVNKYTSLYTGPLSRFGTIEFRHAPTFSDQSQMLIWLRIIRDLMAYAQQHTAEEIVSHAYDGMRHLTRAVPDLRHTYDADDDCFFSTAALSVAEVFANIETTSDEWESFELTDASSLERGAGTSRTSFSANPAPIYYDEVADIDWYEDDDEWVHEEEDW